MKTLAFLWLVTISPTDKCIKQDKAESFQTVVQKSTYTAVTRIEIQQRIKLAPQKNHVTVVTYRDAKGKIKPPVVQEGSKILGGWPKSCFKIQATRLTGKTVKLK